MATPRFHIGVRAENVIYFVTASGFFIGFMFCIVNIDEPTDILFYTLEITLFFYLLTHVAVMVFIDTDIVKTHEFSRKEYEQKSAEFIREIEEREQKMEILLRPLTLDKSKKKQKDEKSQKQQAA